MSATATATLHDHASALKFITCGSVDDGKSTLIGRLLVDSKAVLQDQLAGVQRLGETDLALLTDGLSAEREQGITIDVAYRYFATPSRKFIIGDAPGHEQYTRNMVTAASSADAAVVLVDATKLQWQDAALELLPQTRRHSLLANLLRVPSIVFAVNKLDAVEDPTEAFNNISGALKAFTAAAGIEYRAIVPISALKGHNVVAAQPGWCGYQGLSLLQLLETLDVTAAETTEAFAFPVQWVEKFSSSADTSQGRRVFWGRVATGDIEPGQQVKVLPSGQTATVAQVLDHARAAPQRARRAQRGHRAGPRSRRFARRLAAGPGRGGAFARDFGHGRLAGRRAAGCRPRVLGAARPPLGQGPRQAHRPQAGRQHAGRSGRRSPRAELHRPRRPGAAGAAGNPAVRALAHPRLAGAGGHRQPQDLRGCAG